MCYSWNDHQEFKTNLIKNIYNKSPPDKNGNSRHCGNDLLPGELWPEQDKPWGDFNFYLNCSNFNWKAIWEIYLTWQATLFMFFRPWSSKIVTSTTTPWKFLVPGYDHHVPTYHLSRKVKKRNSSWARRCIATKLYKQVWVESLCCNCNSFRTRSKQVWVRPNFATPSQVVLVNKRMGR